MTPPANPPTRARVLVVEDSSVFREMQALLLRQAGLGVWSFESPVTALAEAARQTFELALVDYELPGMNGAQFMRALRELQPGIPVIFISGSLTLELVSDLTRQGASGIFRKPTNPRVLLEKIHETLDRASASDLRAGTNLDTGISREPFSGPEPALDRLAYVPHHVYGASDAFRAFTHRLWRVRDFRSVLLMQGNAGSPFDLLAQELIRLSAFRAGPRMNCEPGHFEPRRLCEILAPALLANTAGTLIVHGVDDFAAEQQQMLNELVSLRGIFQPFARCLRILLAATPRLAARVEAGTFDEALYFKINRLSLTVPSLAEIRGDIPVNSVRLLEHYRTTVDARAPATLAADATEWLQAQPWPGDYTQLAHTLFFALRHAIGPELSAAALEAAAQDFELQRQTSASAAGRPAILATPSIEFAPDATSAPPAVRVHPAHVPGVARAAHPR